MRLLTPPSAEFPDKKQVPPLHLLRRNATLANAQTGKWIMCAVLHPDNPIKVFPDYHTDQVDPVWVMQKKGTRLRVREGKAAKKSAFR